MATPRHNIADAMIFVVATTAGLIVVWQAWDIAWYRPHEKPWPPAGTASEVALSIPGWISLMSPLVALWSVAVAIVGLRRPRLPLRRLVQRPGMAGCFAVTVVLVFRVLMTLLPYLNERFLLASTPFRQWIWHGRWDRMFSSGVFAVDYRDPQLSYVVLTSWVLLWLGGHWRSDPRWAERTGRVVGAYWIALFPLDLFRCMVFDLCVQ